MHNTAMNNCKSFFDTYSTSLSSLSEVHVVEIGSQDVNGSLRAVCPKNFKYTGLDFQKAKGVDIVLDDPYKLPFEENSVDIILSSSCFEHSEMFWLVYLEVIRVLKPGGLFYLNAPSSGSFHRFPVDCWRFYPDSGKALVAWASRNGMSSEMLETYTQIGGSWQDCVTIFVKDSARTSNYPNRIIDKKKDFENGIVYGVDTIFNPSYICQNEKMIPWLVFARFFYKILVSNPKKLAKKLLKE